VEHGGSAVMEIPAPGMMPEIQDPVEPSLLAEFGNQEFTLFGVTASGRDLSDMCPVPPEQRSLAAQNRFMAKLLTSAGIEIPERYAELKSEFQNEDWLAQHRAAKQQEESAREAEATKQAEQITRQQKDQEKVTDERHDRETQAAEPIAVVEQPKPATVEAESLAPLPVIADSVRDIIIEKPAEMPAGNDGAAIGTIASLEPLPPVRSVETEQAIRVRDLYVEEPPIFTGLEPATAAPMPAAEMPPALAPMSQERVIMDSVLTDYEDTEIPAEAADVASAEFITGEEVLLPDLSLSVEDGLGIERPFASVESEPVLVGAEAGDETGGAAPSFAAELFDEERKRSAALAAAEIEVDPEVAARQRFVDQHEWTLEVANTEPELVFEDFTDSLFELVALNETTPAPTSQEDVMSSEADTDMLTLTPTQAEARVELVPPVCKEVAEKLVSLAPAEKEAVSPVVKSVAEAVQEVRLLETSKASAAEVTVATERLKELVIELFDAIGIEYDDEKVEQFVQSLLRPEFMPAPTQAQELDLENMGTHEIKRHFPQLVTTLTDFFAGHPLQALGMFALFRENPGIQRDILAADTWSDIPTGTPRWYNRANA
jgi:hypothetical protein